MMEDLQGRAARSAARRVGAVVLAVVVLTLVGCAVTPEPPTPAPSTIGTFELRILPETWSDDMFHV